MVLVVAVAVFGVAALVVGVAALRAAFLTEHRALETEHRALEAERRGIAALTASQEAVRVATTPRSHPFEIRHRVVVHTRDDDSISGVLLEAVVNAEGHLTALVLGAAHILDPARPESAGESFKGQVLVPGETVRIVEDNDR